MDKLYFRILGEGTPLFILHGLLGSSDNWISLAKIWSKTHKVYLIDLRNHGQSFHSDQFNYDLMANDVYELIMDESIQSVDIIGHSMGGKVAMKLAVQHPSKIKNLVIIDIAPKYYPVHHEQILKGLKAIQLSNLASRNEADETLKKYVNEAGIRQFLLKNLKRNAEGYIWKMNLNVISEQIENVGENLKNHDKFDGPTLFIRGGNSDYINGADLAQINKIFPKSKVETIDNAGHWVHAEKPTELMMTINQFINSSYE